MKIKIWVDLENSPHVLFFNPIIKELRKRNFHVVITARDYAQVFALSDLFGLKYLKIGKHFGKNKIMKTIGLCSRSLRLLFFIFSEKPSLSLSHGSRAQFLASKLARLPCIIAGDYEYAQNMPFLKADLYLVPEVLAFKKNVMQPSRRFFCYPGIKEDVYVPEFIPDARLPVILKIDDGSIIATMRPPAIEAHYHNPESSYLFDAILKFLCDSDKIKIVMLPRTKHQKDIIENEYRKFIDIGKIIIPEHAVNGLDLIYYSDMVLSGGGTMIREAAALNVPSYSFFRGKIGTVDKHLAHIGRLTLIESTDDIPSKILIKHRKKPKITNKSDNTSLLSIVNHIETQLDVLLNKPLTRRSIYNLQEKH